MAGMLRLVTINHFLSLSLCSLNAPDTLGARALVSTLTRTHGVVKGFWPSKKSRRPCYNPRRLQRFV